MDGSDDALTDAPTAKLDPQRSDPEARAQSSTLEALRQIDESARLDLRVLGAATFASALLLQLSEHQNALHWVTTALLVLTAAASIYLDRQSRGRRGLSELENVVVASTCALAGLSATAYLGALSAVAVTICALVFGWGLGSSRAAAWAVYATSAVGYLALALMALTNVLPLTGSVLALTRDNPRAVVGLTLAVEMVLAISFWTAQRTRRALSTAMARTLASQQELNRRGALLDEARGQLNDLLEGTKLGPLSGKEVGPYHVAEVIGRGGMGEIYRATERESGTPAAIKVLHASAKADPTALERFFREAEASSSLDSPHIARVLGTGTTDDGLPWLAMELLEGVDLARHLREEGRLSPAEVQDLAAQLSRALAVAERAGIVHRDLKPQNVFRSGPSDKPLWKLLDFGVSKLARASGTLTGGAAVGTPAYMSPEQVRGQEVDHRADVYALGAIVYRALVGRPAFSGPDPLSIMYQVDQHSPVRPSSLRTLHPDVDLVLGLALAKEPNDRFDSAPELSSALASALRGELDEELRRRAEKRLKRYRWREPGQGETAPSDAEDS